MGVRIRIAASLATVLIIGACATDTGITTAGSSITETSPSTVALPVASTTITASTTAAPPPVETVEPLRGFSLSPRSTTTEDFQAFLDLAAAGGTLLEWVGDGFEWESDAGTPDVTVGLAASIGVEPITVGGWARTEDGSLIRPLTDENFAAYVDAAQSFATRHRPALIGFGVEVDTHWREFPELWEDSTALFAAVADAIHGASPETQVFVAFQLERLRGLQGGLFGGENDEALAAWHLIDDFPDADLIGFTTYPGLVFESPAEIPDDYYSSILDHVDRPIGFSEMGWQAGGDMGAWSGTPQLQAEFVSRFSELIRGLDVVFYTWSFLFDQPIGAPFEFLGLFDSDGTARPGWEAWLGAG